MKKNSFTPDKCNVCKNKKVSVQLNVNNSFIAEQCNFCRHTDKP